MHTHNFARCEIAYYKILNVCMLQPNYSTFRYLCYSYTVEVYMEICIDVFTAMFK